MSGVHHSTVYGRKRSRSCRSQGQCVMQRDLYWKKYLFWMSRLTKMPTETSEKRDRGRKKNVNNATFDLKIRSRFKFHEITVSHSRSRHLRAPRELKLDDSENANPPSGKKIFTSWLLIGRKRSPNRLVKDIDSESTGKEEETRLLRIETLCAEVPILTNSSLHLK